MTDFEQAFENNEIVGIADAYDKKIDTALSRVFLYSTKVFKIYRHEVGFVGDFNNFAFRKSFYAEDFFWNQHMSPAIYVALRGFCKNDDGKWEMCDMDKAVEFAIEMNRVDTQNTLHNYLLDEKVTEKIVRDLADTIMQGLVKLTQEKRESIPAFQREWRDLFTLRLKDIRDFGYMAESKGLSKERTDMLVDTLTKLLDDPYVTEYDKSKYIVAIDNHADHILVTESGIEFMDVYQFKDYWLAVDPLIVITRPAMDIIALGGEELGKIFLEQASKYYPLPDEKIVTQYLIYSACITGVYYVIIGEKEVAQKYQDATDGMLKTIVDTIFCSCYHNKQELFKWTSKF
jgi:aminoglycoside phosphotransferase family enzyme